MAVNVFFFCSMICKYTNDCFNVWTVDIIKTAYYIHGSELMKLIFAVLDVSLTIDLTRCYTRC